jgi:hypothetical protein
MEFSDLFREFGASIGLDELTLDADGSCTLKFDGEHDVTFTLDAEDRSLVIHCEVGEAGSLDKDKCLELMEASLLGAQTGVAALSVHTKLGKIILWKRHDDAHADAADLTKALNSFLAQVISWKERLSQLPAPALAEGEAYDWDLLNHSIRV